MGDLNESEAERLLQAAPGHEPDPSGFASQKDYIDRLLLFHGAVRQEGLKGRSIRAAPFVPGAYGA